MNRVRKEEMAKYICKHLIKKKPDYLYCKNCDVDNIPCGFSLDIAEHLINKGYVNIYDILEDYSKDIDEEKHNDRNSSMQTEEVSSDSKYIF